MKYKTLSNSNILSYIGYKAIFPTLNYFSYFLCQQ